jgi:hypothetical protein
VPVTIRHARHENHAVCIDDFSPVSRQPVAYGRNPAVLDQDVTAFDLSELRIHRQQVRAAYQYRP